MGVDLRNDYGDYLPLTWTLWEHALRTATAHGWRPRGTLPNRAMIGLQLESRNLADDEFEAEVERVATEWNGSYLYNEYQIVEDADALALGDALERALVSQPEAAVRVEPSRVLAGGEGPIVEITEARVRELIEFFRRGRFRVG